MTETAEANTETTETRPDLIFKVEAEGDELYITAPDEDAAYAAFKEKIGEAPREVLTFTVVDSIPEGQEAA